MTDRRHANRKETLLIELALQRFKNVYYAKKALDTAQWQLDAVTYALKDDEFVTSEVERLSKAWQKWEDQGVSPV